MAGIKITAADKWFSKCVRERNNWTCEYAGTVFGEGQIHCKANGLECSHFYTRGNWSVRFEPLNAFAHSTGSHFHLGGNPSEFKEWVMERLGPDYDVLVEMSNDINRARECRRANKGRGKNNALATHYRLEFDRMREMRNDGFEGRIEFTGFI